MSDTEGSPPGQAGPRYAIPDREQLDERQREMLDQFRRFSLNGDRGPFKVMLHSPDAAGKFQALGKHLRFASALSDRLMEFAVLVHARIWSDQYEWHLHAPRAAAAGIGPEVIAALRAGRVPEGLNAEEESVFEIVCALEIERRIGDPAFARARDVLGDKAITDLILALGQYGTISMLLAAAEEGSDIRELPPCASPFVPA